MKKLTKQQVKNREKLRECLYGSLKTKEQMIKESKEFQKNFKKMFG